MIEPITIYIVSVRCHFCPQGVDYVEGEDFLFDDEDEMNVFTRWAIAAGHDVDVYERSLASAFSAYARTNELQKALQLAVENPQV